MIFLFYDKSPNIYIKLIKDNYQGENKMRRTLEGTKRKRQNVSGFRARMATAGGQEVINRRRAKGRHKLAIEAKKRA